MSDRHHFSCGGSPGGLLVVFAVALACVASGGDTRADDTPATRPAEDARPTAPPTTTPAADPPTTLPTTLPTTAPARVRFATFDIFVDPAGKPLAAYQLEFVAPAGVTLVGIEGGTDIPREPASVKTSAGNAAHADVLRATDTAATTRDQASARGPFAEPPYYDPEALALGRVVIAAYSIRPDLPTTRVRVARLHVQLTGDAPATGQVKLIVASDPQGNRLDATATVQASVQEGVRP